MTIAEFLTLCRKNIALLIIFPIIFGIGAACFCWGFMTNDYTSTVPIYVLQHQTKDIEGINAITQNEITASQQLSNDIAVLVKSSRVNDAVMNDLNIDSLSDFDMKVTSNENNRVINLTVTGKNPAQVADVVNSIAKNISSVVVDVMNVEAVKIIQTAEPSSNPSGPHRMLITLIAIFVGLFVAIMLMLLIDLLSTKMKNKEDWEKTYDVPVLAQVPFIKALK